MQAESLFARHAFEQMNDLVKRRRQRDLARADLQLARFDTRYVEHVVQQSGQRACRGDDGFDVGLLPSGERAARERLRQTENSVHRRTQFVTDHREEPGLRLGGGLGLVLGRAKFLLALLQRGHVGANADNSPHGARRSDMRTHCPLSSCCSK